MAQHHSLRTYLAIFAVILSSATVAGLALVTEAVATRQVEQSIGNNLALRAQEVADKLDRGMYERRQDIQLEVRTFTDSSLIKPSLIRKRLNALRETSNSYAWIGYADTEGKVLSATDGLLEGENVAQRPWFSGAASAAFIGDVHHANLLEKYLNPNGGELLRFMDIAMPILNSVGLFVGVLGAHIDWRWVREVATATQDDGQHTETLILSVNDKVLLGPRDLQDSPLSVGGAGLARQGLQGYQIERWPDGKTYLNGYVMSRGHKSYPGLGWVVLVREELDHAYAPVKALRKKLLVVGMVIATLFAAIGWFLAVFISRPLIGISNAALTLQQPNRKITVPISHGFREVAVLSHSLSDLVKTLMQRETQLEHQAKHHSVTDLPNRVYLMEMLDKAIVQSSTESKQIVVLALSVDRFNTIIDALDDAAGNTALLEMRDRIKACIDPSWRLSHLDTEEFVVFFSGRETLLSRAMGLASLLQQALTKPVSIRGFDFFLSGSFGISIYPKDGLQGETVLRHAEAALQQARVRGGNRIEVYEPEAHARIIERLVIERDLRHALDRQEFELFYQPQFSAARNAIVGVEALIRWRHPERGMISPGLFIPIAEASGLILPIGDWVLEQACAQAQAWREEGLPTLTVSVNVAAPQFISGELARKVSAAMAAHGIEPQQLKLEITESMVMQDAEVGIAVMNELVALDVRVSLDDFGTGYSSLSNLKRFPLSELKIDQSFVRELTMHSQDAALVKAIIMVGHDLGLSVIAEGVETQAQLDFLLQAGCNAIQGYYIGKPMNSTDLATYLRGDP